VSFENKATSIIEATCTNLGLMLILVWRVLLLLKSIDPMILFAFKCLVPDDAMARIAFFAFLGNQGCTGIIQ